MHAIDQQSLEVRWYTCKGAIETLCADDAARRERVRLVLLEAEKEDLEDQLAEDADVINDLELTAAELESSLRLAEADVNALHADLSSRVRDLDRLQAQLASFQDVATSSQQLLSEKLSLTREISTLRPEIEHLRAQQASNQDLLSEKLALQRQLSTVELELDNERKGNKRVQAKESSRQVHEEELHTQLEGIREELAKETRSRQKSEREASKLRSESEYHNTAQESRIDALRTKLKVAKDELRKTQSQLEESRIRAPVPAVADVAGNVRGKGRKRDFTEVSGEVEIATPGAMPEKKAKKSSALGEKSLFSMTPFLKRTGSVAPENVSATASQNKPNKTAEVEVEESTVNTNDEQADEQHEPEPEPESEPEEQIPKPKPRGRPPKTTKPKVPPEQMPAPSKSAKASDLAQVEEEDEDDGENMERSDQVAELPKAPAAKQKKPVSDLDDMSFIKKKRKILGSGLGKTIFDDDEAAPVVNLGRGATKARGLGGLGSVRLPATGAGRGKGLGGFAGFSPRKKDKKVTAV